MGLNAQTSVPEFTTGQVLTAQQQTDINTGIPVFATTTTRDAAFGGTGEKTLAEGQFAYIEATNTTQYYDGADWQSVVPTFTTATFATQQSTTSTTYTDLATSGPAVTVTTGAKVYVILTGYIVNNTIDKTAQMSFAVSGASTIAATDDQMLANRSAITGGQDNQMSAIYELTVTPGSNTFTAKYKQGSAGGTAFFASRSITVITL